MIVEMVNAGLRMPKYKSSDHKGFCQNRTLTDEMEVVDVVSLKGRTTSVSYREDHFL